MQNWSLFKEGKFMADMLFNIPYDAFEFLRQISYTYQPFAKTSVGGNGESFTLVVTPKDSTPFVFELTKQG